MFIFYQSYGGGTNNLAIALDAKTGEFSTSLIDKDHAIRALRKKLLRRDKAQHATPQNHLQEVSP